MGGWGVSNRRTIVVAGALAATACLAAPAGATFPGTNGEIVTQSFKDNRALGATTEAGVRTELPIEGGYPSFSRDGETLIYSCDTDLCTANADGTNERTLAKAPRGSRYRWPGFSRDGKTIVFVAGPGTLSVMSASGKRVREVPNAGRAWQPEFSPANDRIVFSRRAGKSRDLYSVKPNGRGLTRLSNAPALAWDVNPSFAPDGDAIAFERVKLSGGKIARDEIWVMDADGDDAKALVAEGGDFLAATPAFSPDGTKIAFSFNDVGAGLGYVLSTMNADGTGQVQLSEAPALQPTWRPLP